MLQMIFQMPPSWCVFMYVRHAVVQICVPLPPWAVRAGARREIFFDPKKVNAAIVTCGGEPPSNLAHTGLLHLLQGPGHEGLPSGQPLSFNTEVLCRSLPRTERCRPRHCLQAGGLWRARGEHTRNQVRLFSAMSIHFRASMSHITRTDKNRRGAWIVRNPLCVCLCRYGFRGFYDRTHKPVVLTQKYVEGIQLKGGTILGTSRYDSSPPHFLT